MKRPWLVAAATALLTISGVASADTLTPIPVKTTRANEITAAAQGQWFSWAQNSRAHPNHYDVYVQRPGGNRIRLNRKGYEGAGGGIDGRTVVYYQYQGRFAGDILTFNLRTRRRGGFPEQVDTRFDEYHPTISKPWVLFTRYIDTTQTTKVVLYNLKSQHVRVLATETGAHRRVYSGQVNGTYATYGRVAPSGQDVFLYDIPGKTATKVPRLVFAQYDPSVTAEGTVYYERSGDECGAQVRLVRYPIQGSPTVLYKFPAGLDGGYTYADERTDGSLHVYYGTVKCRNSRWDIYKVIDSYKLTVAPMGTGSGTVTSDPAGISCGTDCGQVYHGGTEVTLTATPDSGSTFMGWSGSTCGTNPICKVTVEADTTMEPIFDTAG